MKITTVETFVLSNRRMLVRIGTDEGVVGWGEPVLENWARTAAAAVTRMSEHLIGTDPLRTTHLWQILARGGFYRGGPLFGSAVAGIDQALWDIKGRWLGVPIHSLLGGPCRDKIRMYAHTSSSERFGSIEHARTLVADGYTMMKLNPPRQLSFIETKSTVDRAVADLEELREVVGPDIDIAIDLHGRASVPMARRFLDSVTHLHPAFVEEPLRPEHSHLLADITHGTIVPIAVGERLYSRDDFRPALESGIALAQPDLCHAGGITESFRIGIMAEPYDVQVAPHCPLGPVALAACLQIDLALPNFFAQEILLTPHYGGDTGVELLVDPTVLEVRDGYIDRLDGPGLGIDIDEDAVRGLVIDGDLDAGSPIWFAPDGSFAEW